MTPDVFFFCNDIQSTFSSGCCWCGLVQYKLQTLTYLTLNWAWTAKAVKLHTWIVWPEVWLCRVDFSLQCTSPFLRIFWSDFHASIASSSAWSKHRFEYSSKHPKTTRSSTRSRNVSRLNVCVDCRLLLPGGLGHKLSRPSGNLTPCLSHSTTV